MRLLTLFCLIAAPCSAWEFEPSPVCTLTHVEAADAVAVTYDHATGVYEIAVTTGAVWPDAPAFSIRFDGARPNTISTTRHETRDKTLRVTDTGFGNVLDGLQWNRTATAFTAATEVTFSLEGAAGPVQAFRDCVSAPVA